MATHPTTRPVAGRARHRPVATRVAPLAAALALLAALVVLGPAGRARAQGAGESIRSYAVAITIQPDGAIVVEETIDYDFGSADRHGITRDIPVRLHYDNEHDRVYPLDVLSVTGSPGTPTQYQVESVAGGMKRIRIGDPDHTISGEHTYTIRYRVQGALNAFPSHDELYWNAISADQAVPIDHASVDVTAPGDVSQVNCFAGAYGSRLACAEMGASGDAAHFKQGALDAGEAFTVVVAFPPGSVVPPPAPILRTRWSLRRAFTVNVLTVGLAVVLAGALAAGLARLVWTAGRDRRYVGSAVDVAFGTTGEAVQRVGLFGDGGPYPVEYEPPDGIRPGEVGTLVDERANVLDVTATIVDLAARGYLRITEIEKDHFWNSADWKLERLKPSDDLMEYERRLLDGLFEDGDAVQLSALKRTFSVRLHNVQLALYDDAVDKGWFRRSPQTTRGWWLAGGLVALGLAVAIEVAAAAWTTFALVPVPLVLAALALVALHGFMPRRTAKGTGTLRRVYGFRRFIEEAEKEPARFAEQAHLFSDYLAYAVVFGCVDRWAKAFAGLAEPPRTDWYVSSHPFTALAFADAIGSFSTVSAGTIASTPSGSGSSGFGSGGFSGGGGGGGSVGSW